MTALAFVAVLGVTACGADQDDSAAAVEARADAVAAATGGPATGELSEWKVDMNRKTAEAGEVTFWIANKGTMSHEFLVVRTDYPDGEIPLDGDHFSEDAEGVTVVDEISEFEAGTIKELTLELEAGSYQLLCNIPNHYRSGMHFPFTVTE
jgi:uncharacterized cupredoxin-like copper-binding protein